MSPATKASLAIALSKAREGYTTARVLDDQREEGGMLSRAWARLHGLALAQEDLEADPPPPPRAAAPAVPAVEVCNKCGLPHPCPDHIRWQIEVAEQEQAERLLEEFYLGGGDA